ncbi:MAG TPA: phosphatidylglycerol lysyltransferase domain-containing protein [Candidatus Saccharimonadales bacterium]|nr:phosphatidylglycerol lysyltransferase domain-containing protein [Candidatus Saccharimonadales bacterium]
MVKESALLPTFPKFTPLTLQHKDTLSLIANNFPSSDFNFAGLYTWDVKESVMVSSLFGNLVIRTSDYLSHDNFYSFIGNQKVDETIKALTDYAKKYGEQSSLKLIPQSVAELVSDHKAHEVLEDRNNFDYILSVKDLIEFRSNKYRGKKNEHNRFLNKYGRTVIEKEIDLDNTKVQKDVLAVLIKWQLSRGKLSNDVKDEFVAIERALNNHKVLNIQAFGIYIENKLIAFTLFEITPNKVAILHFDKANIEYNGVFVHLKRSFAKHLNNLGVSKINYEQDLGIEGLRKSKESYKPIEYIKKYTISRK